jgi:soluble lytic murein transglycosylase-like protein
MEVISSVFSKRSFALIVCAGALGLATAAQAAAPPAPAPAPTSEDGVELIKRPSARFDRSLEAAALEVRYDVLLEQARNLEVAPEDHLLTEQVTTEPEIRSGIESLGDRVETARKEARQERREEAAFAPSGGTIHGVSLATLETIAACESGGDPTAVNPAGYFGKYQFDMGTWASVGGSGNPAEASEEEQDYRAALLYSRAGSSPWPVCGA